MVHASSRRGGARFGECTRSTLGELSLWFEARTSEDWSLNVDSTPLTFIINGEGPTLLDVSPDLDAYINEEVYRTVSFSFHDVGGFSNETLSAYTWLEARDDGTNGGASDGVPQREEYHRPCSTPTKTATFGP